MQEGETSVRRRHSRGHLAGQEWRQWKQSDRFSLFWLVYAYITVVLVSNHQIDVYGPLAPCSNCDKTKKSCTFEWLRSQRVAQACATPQTNPTPATKRRRKNSSQTDSTPRSHLQQNVDSKLAPPPNVPDIATTCGGDFVPQGESSGFGLTFADFPIPSFDMSLFATAPIPSVSDSTDDNMWDEIYRLNGTLEDEDQFADRDSGQGSSLETSSEGLLSTPEGDSPEMQINAASELHSATMTSNGCLIRVPRKRRRRSSSTSAPRISQCANVSFANDILSNTSRTMLAEGLLKIYHDSFENALSCWLTERTCPYSKDSAVSLANDTGPDWNRIYHRVFRLDRIASSIKGRNLNFAEDRAASKALNLAIFSFATQWSGDGNTNKYPFHSEGQTGRNGVFNSDPSTDSFSTNKDPDRSLQLSVWHEARHALHEAAEIESFRVVLAHIVFSLTQKPMDTNDTLSTYSNGLNMADGRVVKEEESDQITQDTVNDCGDLLSKLNLTIEEDGPPVYLEQGLRLIHSLRSRIAIQGTINRTPRCSKHSTSATRLDATDRTTVDLLFWLGVMFDTLSSAMHKRPLVVSDEDSNIYVNDPRPSVDVVETKSNQLSQSEGLWDEHLFARQKKRLEAQPVRWPCAYDQAASLLCDAAPVKVLLFRKVTRIQTLISRNIRGQRIESAIRAALDVCDHWEHVYAGFIQDCIENHDDLPPKMQSWYSCLTGHWLLATLLLADLIEIVDDSELGMEINHQERLSTDFVYGFRQINCRRLSDIAGCACPREDATFSKSYNFHFALNQGALMTEPWTAVLIRAFAKAGVILLESHTSEELDMADQFSQEDAFRRADNCVKALWYLGRKSDMALSAAKILGDALRQRRKGAEEKFNDMSTFLEAELWEGFDEMSHEFGTDCV